MNDQFSKNLSFISYYIAMSMKDFTIGQKLGII